MKTCSRCGTAKLLTAFSRKGASKDGHASACKACLKPGSREYHSANRERNNARSRAHYNANRAARSAYARDYYRKNADKMKLRAIARRDPQRQRHLRLLRTYGFTLDQFAKMAAAQGGCCAICRQPADLVVDHDHTTSAVRGLLCSTCNIGLGTFGDDPERLLNAAAYLHDTLTFANRTTDPGWA